MCKGYLNVRPVFFFCRTHLCTCIYPQEYDLTNILQNGLNQVLDKRFDSYRKIYYILFINDRNAEKVDPLKAWAISAGVLGTALELCRVCVIKDAAVLAEVYLQLGKVQSQLHQRGGPRACEARVVGNTLIEAIVTSMGANQDLG